MVNIVSLADIKGAIVPLLGNYCTGDKIPADTAVYVVEKTMILVRLTRGNYFLIKTCVKT